MNSRYIFCSRLLLVSAIALCPFIAPSAHTARHYDSASINAADRRMHTISGSTKQSEEDNEEISWSEWGEHVATKLPAVEENPVNWQISFSKSLVRDMLFISSEHLLVNFLRDNPTLINTAKGEIIWRYIPSGWLISCPEIVAAFADLILLHEYKPKENNTILAAVDAGTGKQLWMAALQSKKRSFQFLPIPAAGIVLVVELEKKKAGLSALDLFSGEERWQAEYKIDKEGHPSPPHVSVGSMWHFYGKVARVDPNSGTPVWERNEIVQSNQSPPPVFQDGNIYIVDKENFLHILNANSGDISSSIPLDKTFHYTNIHPSTNHIYLRGEAADGTAILAALERKSSNVAWTYSSTQPTVSNLIEDHGVVYAASPSKVYCIEIGSGTEIYSVDASQTGQTFPVRLRKFGNTLVYIGELVVAGFDANTGERLYFHGMTPVSQLMHLDALDNWTSVLEQRIGRLSKGMWFGGGSDTGNAFLRQAAISQNLSNQYSSQASYYRGLSNNTYNMSANSDYWKSVELQNQAQIEGAYAGAMAQISFFFAVQDITNAMLASSVAQDRAKVSSLQSIRNVIISAYTAAEFGEYVYRPHAEDDWAGVILIHQPTGKSHFAALSPLVTDSSSEFPNDRCIWNLIDFENSVIYHNGLRILPEQFQKKVADPDKKAYGIHLVAEKIHLP